MRPQVINNIMEIIPYKGGESKIAGVDKVYKLSSNENPLGCSPLAKQAFIDAAQDLNMYPDGAHLKLREAIAKRYDLQLDRLLCGNGSDEIFQLLGRSYLAPNDEVIQSQYGFLSYSLIAQQQGAKTIFVETDDNYKTQIDGIIAAVTAKTKIIFLDNPSNPTGTYLPFSEIKRLHAAIPDNVILVLDAAYAEFVKYEDYDAGKELAEKFENVIMTRTFSKIHGLAALRIGWAYGSPDIIGAMNRVRDPFNVNSPALAAGVAAINDDEFVSFAKNFTSQWGEKLSNALDAAGFKVIPSVTNFIMIECGSEERANRFDAHLKRYGIIIRKVASYNLPANLRISIGSDEANELLIKAIKEFE